MAKACGVLAAGALGFAAPLGLFDEQLPWGDTPTVYLTQTETVQARYQGWTARRWAAQSTKNRREANLLTARSETLTARVRSLQRSLRVRWTPTVSYAISLASRVFGVDEDKMRAVAFCESTMNPLAVNGRYRGLFQLGWSPFGFSPFDPVASALSTAQTVVHDGSWRQWACG